MATADRKAPLLTLDTLIVRERVVIDKQSYELRNGAEFSVFDLRRLEQYGERIGQIELMDAPTQEDQADYANTLDTVVRLVLIAPNEIHAKLLTSHRTLIVQAFIALLQPSLPLTRATKEATARPAKPTGARARRGSRASTAGRRSTG